MKIEIEIPEYTPEKGLKIYWKDNFQIKATSLGSDFVIEANKEGLISIATQLLAMAYNNVPSGFHIHYEDGTCLEDGSARFVIEVM
ncbi:Imm32 family immunity protein [Paenibacillus phytorum]|uniref:Imm32 family immunity protein n=1 Tax=Paenibacillus phytorum TaxID=2654977 RepID=UPI001C11E01C|nr:hypothetical protein [Paenibacillus phytorum]